jgi:predicted Fe-Mo cluster-binding NifX family protein
MKIALINDNGTIGGHLPHARDIVVYDMELNTLMEYKDIEQGVAFRADWLLAHDCEAVIGSGVSTQMLEALNENGIQAFQGEGLMVEEAIDAYLQQVLGRFVLDAGGCGCGGNCSCGAH